MLFKLLRVYINLYDATNSPFEVFTVCCAQERLLKVVMLLNELIAQGLTIK